MKAILIDPYDRTVSSVTLPNHADLDQIKEVIKAAEWVGMTYIGKDNVMVVDDEGLLHVTADSRFFVIKDSAGNPLHMIVGRALVLSHDGSGELASTNLTPGETVPRVHFITDNAKAAELAERMLDGTTVCSNFEEYRAACERQIAMLREAVAL